MLDRIFKIKRNIKELFSWLYRGIIHFLFRLYKIVTNPKFIAVSIVVVVALFVTGWGTYSFMTKPETCIKCHEMKPEYVTWRASAHNTFGCVDCHTTEKGIKKNVTTIAQRLIKHFTGNFNQPIEIEKETKDKICLQCHSSNRKISASGDLEFPHKRHVQRGFNCVECHLGSAHGSINSKGFTTNTNYEIWTIGSGKAYMKPKLTETSMEKCMFCHEDKEVGNQCSTCHNSIGNPKDHQDKNWLQLHGQKAVEDINYCDSCHSYSKNLMGSSDTELSFADYARNNKFCSKCHVGIEGESKDFQIKNKHSNKRGTKINNYKPLVAAPLSHNEDWRQTHGQKAKADKNSCLVCHDEIKKSQAISTTTYCTKCHKWPHLKPVSHQVPITKLNNSCFQCHHKESCNTCHGVK